MQAASQDEDLPPRARSRAEALREAVPDMIIAGGCALAWIAPSALGFDLLKLFGDFFALEIAVVLLLGMAGIRRVPEKSISREDRLWFIVLPLVILIGFAWGYAGTSGLLAMLCLGGRTLWAQHRERQDTRPPVTGLWLRYSRSGTGVLMEITTTRPTPSGDPKEWCVPAGQEQKMSHISLFLWLGVAFALVGLDLPALGATAEYAASVGWVREPLHKLIPAHLAVAAGALFFTGRTLAHFHGTTAEPDDRQGQRRRFRADVA